MPQTFDALSIVLQGPAVLGGKPTAKLAARSARAAFPDAEIIVSCWENDPTDGISAHADKIVTSVDPGPQRHGGGVLNINRQLVSSRAGAEAATRPYVLKARSDLVFHNARIWREYLSRQPVFLATHGRDPVLITNLTSVNPGRQPRYFALCDWIYLGPRQMISALLAAPPFPDAFLDYPVDGVPMLRFNAEQWIIIHYLARHGLDLESFGDGYQTCQSISQVHQRLVGSHFALASWFRLGLGTQKHRISSFSLDKMYTQREWDTAFLGRPVHLDPERLAIALAYHPLLRAVARRLRRFRNA